MMYAIVMRPHDFGVLPRNAPLSGLYTNHLKASKPWCSGGLMAVPPNTSTGIFSSLKSTGCTMYKRQSLHLCNNWNGSRRGTNKIWTICCLLSINLAPVFPLGLYFLLIFPLTLISPPPPCLKSFIFPPSFRKEIGKVFFVRERASY